MDDVDATTLLQVEGLGIVVRVRCAYVDVLWREGGALDAGETGVLAAGATGADIGVVVAAFALVIGGVTREYAWSPSSLVVTFSLRPMRDGERLQALRVLTWDPPPKSKALQPPNTAQ
jgi:hypothetical protein